MIVTFGLGMAVLGAAYSLVAAAISADTDGKPQDKPSKKSPSNTTRENDTIDS